MAGDAAQVIGVRTAAEAKAQAAQVKAAVGVKEAAAKVSGDDADYESFKRDVLLLKGVLVALEKVGGILVAVLG